MTGLIAISCPPLMQQADYLASDWDVKNDKKKQELIIRQNSWTQALKYIEVISTNEDVDLKKDDLTIDRIKKLAETIESHIQR